MSRITENRKVRGMSIVRHAAVGADAQSLVDDGKRRKKR